MLPTEVFMGNYWRNSYGKMVLISDMHTRHIKNALKMLRSRGFVGEDEVEAARNEFVDLTEKDPDEFRSRINRTIDVMKAELARRAYKEGSQVSRKEG